MPKRLLEKPHPGGLAAVLLASVVFCWPLLTRAALPYGSDSSYHSQWAHGFVAGIAEGIAYPRWINDANRGFGAPVFLIYPPLSYYAIAAAKLFTDDVLSALRAVLVGAAFLSGLAFYFAARERFSELGSALGAALYILMPYHGLDLYDRFALAEYVAFLWLPLLFLAVRRLSREPSPGAWLLLSSSYAGLLLTHLMSGYLVLFVLGPYALALVIRSRRFPALGAMASAGLVGVLCASIYLVPFLVHRDEVHTDWLASPHYDWRRNFLYRDEVALGYKPDIVKPWAERSASTQALLAAAAAALLWLRSRRPAPEASRETEAPREGWLHAALALWALYLQTPLATPLYKHVPELAAAQFPWRFSALQMLCTAFLCAAAVSATRGTAPAAGAALGGPGKRLLATLRRHPSLAAALLLVAALPALRVTAQVSESRKYDLTPAKARHPLYRYRVVKEFFPLGVEGWLDWETSAPMPSGSGVRLGGPGRAFDLEWAAERRSLRVEAPAPLRVIFRTFAYPGWQARIDGEAAPILADGPIRVIEVEVPEGAHRVEVVFLPTWDRRLGAGLSCSGLALLAGVAIHARRRRRAREA